MSPPEILAVLRLVGRAAITYLRTRSEEEKLSQHNVWKFFIHTHVHVGQKNHNNANVLKFFIPDALNVDEG